MFANAGTMTLSLFTDVCGSRGFNSLVQQEIMRLCCWSSILILLSLSVAAVIMQGAKKPAQIALAAIPSISAEELERTWLGSRNDLLRLLSLALSQQSSVPSPVRGRNYSATELRRFSSC